MSEFYSLRDNFPKFNIPEISDEEYLEWVNIILIQLTLALKEIEQNMAYNFKIKNA
jgi:hypothetical protein